MSSKIFVCKICNVGYLTTLEDKTICGGCFAKIEDLFKKNQETIICGMSYKKLLKLIYNQPGIMSLRDMKLFRDMVDSNVKIFKQVLSLEKL